MDQDTDVHLRWNNHQTTLLSVFSSLLGNENLVDCTLSAEGQYFKAHRVILSACSPYFELLFSEHCENEPIIILPDVNFPILKALIEFMYCGEIKVPQNKLSTVLELAETLQIKSLSVTGESEMKDDLRPKRKNESSILCHQQRIKKIRRDHRHGSEVKQEDVLSLNTSEKESSEDTDSHLLTTQECANNSSNSVCQEKTSEEPAVSQDITDSEAFNVFLCSSLNKTQNKSNTHVSGRLLNSVSKTSDFSQLLGSSKETIGEQRILSEIVPLMCSSSGESRRGEPVGMNGERPTLDLLQEIKQEDPDDFKGKSIEEIIIDDDTNENEDYEHGSGDDNSGTFGGRVITEESFSGQSFSSLEQYGDTYFGEPSSLLPNQFKCNACGKSYRYQRCLWRHLKYECGKEPQFWCSQCPGRFFHKHVLKDHISRIHSAQYL